MQNIDKERMRCGDVAARLEISLSTLAKWRARGAGPVAHRNGPRIIYYLSREVEAYLAECDARPANAALPSEPSDKSPRSQTS